LFRLLHVVSFLWYHSACPLVGIGTAPPPLPQESVSPPPELKGEGEGGPHSPTGERVGESQFRRLEKWLSTLSTLCLGAIGACDPPCENGGRCRKNGSCKCRPGYYGKACQTHRNDIAGQTVAAHSGRKAQLIQRYLAAAHGSQLNKP
jgi:hypothetical protein